MDSLDQMRMLAGIQLTADQKRTFTEMDRMEDEPVLDDEPEVDPEMDMDDESEMDEDTVTCPVCDHEGSKAEMFDHLMDEHGDCFEKEDDDESETDDEDMDDESEMDDEDMDDESEMDDGEDELDIRFENASVTEAEGAVEVANMFDLVKPEVDDSPESPMAKDTDKVEVPKEHCKTLDREIKELRAEAKKVESYNPDLTYFYDKTADLFEKICSYLKDGTEHSIRLAQHEVGGMMGPMIQRFPPDVYLFIVGGGKPRKLKDIYTEVKLKKQD